MLSKEQADVISDELLAKTRGSNAAKDSILHRWRNTNRSIFPFIFASLPLSFWLRHQNGNFNGFYFLAIALLCALGIFAVIVGIYQRRTPLIKIDKGILICYGSVPWVKKNFLLSAIDSVIFTKNPNSWRSAYQLSIQVYGIEHRIWLPTGRSSPAPLIRKMLFANFKDKFLESEI